MPLTARFDLTLGERISTSHVFSPKVDLAWHAPPLHDRGDRAVARLQRRGSWGDVSADRRLLPVAAAGEASPPQAVHLALADDAHARDAHARMVRSLERVVLLILTITGLALVQPTWTSQRTAA